MHGLWKEWLNWFKFCNKFFPLILTNSKDSPLSLILSTGGGGDSLPFASWQCNNEFSTEHISVTTPFLGKLSGNLPVSDAFTFCKELLVTSVYAKAVVKCKWPKKEFHDQSQQKWPTSPGLLISK